MSTDRDRTVQLPDGRVLGFAEHGDPAGLPLFLFHGTPGSRLECGFPGMEAAMRSRGIRCFALDRPGIGLSRPLPKRSLLGWAADVRAFADAHGIDRFVILGVSGGGPHALACARLLDDRLLAAGVVACPGPPGVAELSPLLPAGARRTQRLARWMPAFLRGPIREFGAAIVRPGVAPEQLVPGASENDRTVLSDEALRGIWLSSWREAFRQGPDGPWWDQVLISRPWGFHVDEIAMPVQLWLGGADREVPVAAGRYLANALRRSEARLYPDEGHFTLMVRRLGEILDGLVVAVGRIGARA